MNICEYGCGQEAIYQFKNGKWCCSKFLLSCPEIRKNQQGKNHPRIGKQHSNTSKKKMSESHTGKKGYWTGKKRSVKTKNKISKQLKGKSLSILTRINMKTSIQNIIDRYPFFSKIEEMRYNPDKLSEKEIQVHCKNHNCLNSKEQGGWFTPSYHQLYERIRQIENVNGTDGSYFYCSQECKLECPLFNLHSDPFKEVIELYTHEEYDTWRNLVLEQDNYECQKCGSKENLHCHHIIPVKLEPLFALDLDNGIVLCKDCHYKYGHKTGTECSTGNLANKVCNKKGKI